ncbi:MAG: purine-cytosine permease family protein [Steroidobacteraceae bacterium]
MASAIKAEHHSIDFIPLNERYGRPSRLFTLWFSVNLHILGVALGALAIAAGLTFTQAIVTLALGNAIGTFVMAAHSAQGPQLGIPQMIQSRAQFGVVGAALPLVAVIVTYVLYTSADLLIIQGTMSSLFSTGQVGSLVLMALVTLVIAYVGYELIHRIGKVMTVVSSSFFIVAAVLIYLRHPASAPVYPASAHVTATAFSLVLAQAAAWGFSYGPYVADYSRYLPADVSPTQTFWCTALGCFLGSMLIMTFGAYLACRIPGLGANPADALTGLFGRARPLAQVLLVLAVVYGNVMNLYSAYMSSCTIFSGFNGTSRVGNGFKLAVMAATMAAAVTVAVSSHGDFQGYFGNILSAMIYMLVPWSGINLADYYMVRKGVYDLRSMFDIYGCYGAYRWRTIAIFVLGIVAQVPFMDFTFYQGWMTQRIGADVAWVPGFLIPAALYTLIERARVPLPVVAPAE